MRKSNPCSGLVGSMTPAELGMLADAIEPHIAEGSTLVHDRERAHNGVVRDLSLADESYKADVNDPVYLGSMALVNNLCSWNKRYPWSFTGMNPGNLQSHLNLYVYLIRVKREGERWLKVARVVRHLLMSDASFRR